MGNYLPDRERAMSDTTTETTENVDQTTAATETDQTSETATASDKDWQAEADKWKALARKHEGSAKANADKARQFDEFSESQKTEQQKAADALAKAKADAESAASELALMKAAVKHGLSEDDLDLLGAHGTPEEIEARAERLSARLKAAEANKPKPDFGGGDKGEDVAAKKGQLGADDVKRMSPEQIVQAKSEGRLNDYLGIKS